MPIFAAGIQQINSSVGTIASLVWNPNNVSATTFGALGSVPTTAVLHDLVIVNSGTVNVYLNSSSQAAAAANGILLPVGGEMTLYGYSGTGGAANNQVWAQAGTVGYTGSTIAGLASIQNAVV